MVNEELTYRNRAVLLLALSGAASRGDRRWWTGSVMKGEGSFGPSQGDLQTVFGRESAGTRALELLYRRWNRWFHNRPEFPHECLKTRLRKSQPLGYVLNIAMDPVDVEQTCRLDPEEDLD
jgi:hypothetical protein